VRPDGDHMSETTERLADILARGIATQEGFARELAEVLKSLRRDGHHASAEAMLRLCHHHRIRGMEDRGNLATLRGDANHDAAER